MAAEIASVSNEFEFKLLLLGRSGSAVAAETEVGCYGKGCDCRKHSSAAMWTMLQAMQDTMHFGITTPTIEDLAITMPKAHGGPRNPAR